MRESTTYLFYLSTFLVLLPWYIEWRHIILTYLPTLQYVFCVVSSRKWYVILLINISSYIVPIIFCTYYHLIIFFLVTPQVQMTLMFALPMPSLSSLLYYFFPFYIMNAWWTKEWIFEIICYIHSTIFFKIMDLYILNFFSTIYKINFCFLVNMT